MNSRYALIGLFMSSVAVLALVGNADATRAAEPRTGAQTAPAAVFDGASYLVTWADANRASLSISAGPPPPPLPPPPPPPPRFNMSGGRMSRAGKPLDLDGIAIATTASPTAAVASSGANSLVVWTDTRDWSRYYDIYGARLTRAGAVLDRAGIPISATSAWESAPSVAFDGTNYLVVWDTRSATGGISGARVTQTGVVVDTDGIRIASGLGSLGSPAVAFGRTHYLVVWQSTTDYGRTYDLHGARVSASGVVLDPDGFLISSAPESQAGAAIAFDGTNFLVVWEDRGFGTGRSDIYAARVSPAGTVLDPLGIGISLGTRKEEAPSVAFDGTNYLVAWADERWNCCSIYGARVTAGGTVLDRDGIAIATRGYEQVSPSVASDRRGSFVAWSDRRSGFYDIYGARVTRAGRVLEKRGILLSTEPPPPVSCLVPRVIGLRLAAARQRLRRAHCSVGRVRTTAAKRTGRVVAQRPRAGTVRRRGYPVRLVVSLR
jgi:hypothetical protein